MNGDIVPDKVCPRCGGPLRAYAMDVGYVELICLDCDNHRNDAPPGKMEIIEIVWKEGGMEDRFKTSVDALLDRWEPDELDDAILAIEELLTRVKKKKEDWKE